MTRITDYPELAEVEDTDRVLVLQGGDRVRLADIITLLARIVQRLDALEARLPYATAQGSVTAAGTPATYAITLHGVLTAWAALWRNGQQEGSRVQVSGVETEVTLTPALPSTAYTLRVYLDQDGPTLLGESLPSTTLPAEFAPRFDAPPAITGAAVVGETITIVPGTVLANPPATVTRELLRDGTPIAGYLGGTAYVLATADAGKMLRVRETAGNGVGEPAVALSAPFGPVQTEPSTVPAGALADPDNAFLLDPDGAYLLEPA
jgi:hypothetical protein